MIPRAREAGLINILMTTGGRRFKHQGIYYLFRKHGLKEMRVILLSGTASYVRAGNNLEKCRVGGSHLEVITVALSTGFSYNDEETLRAARPKVLIHGLEELVPK